MMCVAPEVFCKSMSILFKIFDELLRGSIYTDIMNNFFPLVVRAWMMDKFESESSLFPMEQKAFCLVRMSALMGDCLGSVVGNWWVSYPEIPLKVPVLPVYGSFMMIMSMECVCV